MDPTIKSNEKVLVEKISMGLQIPKPFSYWLSTGPSKRMNWQSHSFLHRQDIIVFFPPRQNKVFVKRIIGLPGDTVEFKENGKIICNDKILSEPYAVGLTKIPQQAPKFLPITQRTKSLNQQFHIPPKYYLLLGDNREASIDSRHWGLVPEQNIIGRVVL